RRRHGLREPPGARTRRLGRHQGRVREATEDRRRLDPEGAGDEETQGRREEQDRRQHRRRSEREVSTLRGLTRLPWISGAFCRKFAGSLVCPRLSPALRPVSLLPFVFWGPLLQSK